MFTDLFYDLMFIGMFIMNVLILGSVMPIMSEIQRNRKLMKTLPPPPIPNAVVYTEYLPY